MSHPKSLQAGTRIDDYEIEATLWTTNSGFIYRARELDRDRHVLVQEYLPPVLATRHWSGIHAMALEGLADDFEQGLTGFLREARILAQINDPYVFRVYEYTETNATAYMVLDYEPGQTLSEHLASRKTALNEEEIRKLLVPLLKGLRVAHASDLVHRDIHPANIYLRDVGPPVLIGFGSPVVTPRDDDQQHVDNRVAPGYTPVEQYQTDGEIGPWSDLYSLGATMYRCLSGATPVDATRRVTHIAQDKEDPLVPAVELGSGDYSAALLSAIDWMLEPMASDRPESAGAVLGPLNDEPAGSPAAPAQRDRDADEAGSGTRAKKTSSKRKKKRHSRKKAGKHSRPAGNKDEPDHDHGQFGESGAPAREPAAPPPAAASPRPVAGTHHAKRAAGTPRQGLWGWPLLLVVAGVAMITVFMAYRPGPNGVTTADPAMPGVDTPIPAPAPDLGYPPPEIPDTVNFGHAQDDERADEYRSLQRKIERIEQLLASAETHIEQGRMDAPPGNNALDAYRAVLDLDPDNSDARLGIKKIQGDLIEAAEAAFDDEQIEEAQGLLKRAASIREKPSGEISALRERIDAHLTEQARRAMQAQAEAQRREEAKRRAEQARRARITRLLRLAESAVDGGRLTRPADDNALAYYRRVLSLEPDHEQASRGIDRIGRRILDRAADALAKDELDAAGELLNTAAAIMPDNESVPLLRKQLETRRSLSSTGDLADREAPEPAPAPAAPSPAETTPETAEAARQQAEEAARIQQRLEQGISAYYSGDYESAFRLLNPLAEQGQPRAKFRVAMMYYHGRGLEPDTNLATTLVREALPRVQTAAESGAAWAQADMASLYADGIVLAENDEEAVRLYKLAAEQGYAGAQTNLGVMYANGEGVAQNRDEAIVWLRRAAAQGDHIAQNNLRALGVQ